MSILVTGSEGRIGRRVVAALQARGETVRSFDTKLGSDLCDAAQVRAAVAGSKAVIHLGAIPHNVVGEEAQVLAVGLRGTHHVLEACRLEGVHRAVCFSSVQALGLFANTRLATSLPVDDTVPSCPQNAYQLSKHLMEQLCATYSQHHGVETVCLRPVYVATPEEYAHWAIRSSNPGPRLLSEYGAYVDVRDVAEAAVLALTAPLSGPECLLLTADDTDALTPTAALVAEHYAHLPWTKDKTAYLAQGTHRSLVDCQRAKTVLGWYPQHSWRD